MSDAAAAVTPTAASSLRRLSSKLNSLSEAIMAKSIPFPIRFSSAVAVLAATL
jgi:hypothetical protein